MKRLQNSHRSLFELNKARLERRHSLMEGSGAGRRKIKHFKGVLRNYLVMSLLLRMVSDHHILKIRILKDKLFRQVCPTTRVI